MTVVLVVGPPLSGVSAVVTALRARLPGVAVVEGASDVVPDAVVGVLSAVAPARRSDWAPVARAAGVVPVVGVVSKIDAHRGWRDVLAADRRSVSAWDGRGPSIPWVGVAAAPDLGEPRVDELVDVLRELLIEGRKCVQTRDSRASGSHTAPRERRTSLQRTRLRLLQLVRDRCTSWRADTREAASSLPFGGAAHFEARVRADAGRLLDELDDEITAATGVSAPATGAGPRVDVGRPPSARALEGRLMTVLGVGFGLGIALAANRLLGGLAPGLAIPGLVAGAAVGLALMTWVVRARRLLHDRALLDRWVTEVASTLRWQGEAMVAEGLLLAESERTKAGSGRPVPAPDRALEQVTDQYLW